VDGTAPHGRLEVKACPESKPEVDTVAAISTAAAAAAAAES
jgi:hypothetical protein